jgi:hypothetical protein
MVWHHAIQECKEHHRNGRGMKNIRHKKGAFGIDDSEWDFSRVPLEEVMKCLLYEYARERIKGNPEVSKTLKKYKEARVKGDSETSYVHYEKLRSYLKTTHSQSVLIYEDMDHVSWIGFQRLLKKESEGLIQRKKRINQRPTSRRDSKKKGPASYKSTESEDLDDMLYQGQGLVLIQNPPYEPGKLFETFCRSLLAGNTILDTDVRREFSGFFAVDWNYSIPEILESFKRWLVSERDRSGIVTRERRGGISSQNKAYVWLNALGAYRLMTMTKHSAEEIINVFQRRLERPPLYSNPPEWSRAKKIMNEAMRVLFC